MQESDILQKDPQLYRIRHSLAHILAQAVMSLKPGTRLGFGPPTTEGFYYDFLPSSPLSEDDFSEIEKRMKHIIKQNQVFSFEDVPAAEALKKIDDMQEPYKREYAEELIKKHQLTSLRFYSNGQFIDMCEGPHVGSTKEIPLNCFKLKSVAGAYWRGSEKNQMMVRIYAFAFKTEEELKTYIKAYQDALARDHKKLGKELDLFHIDDEVGKGLPLWLPKGAVIRDELQKLMEELEFRGGYERVHTPHITKAKLYYQTGHLPYYEKSMYPMMEVVESVDENGGEKVKEMYCLKPMNCPHHHKIFAARMRSYRQLPLRLAEYGQVYRYEDSGAVSGLLRVRGMCMNDAHIYCTKEQILEEFLKVMEMHKELYRILGITDYHMRLSTWDPSDPLRKDKFVDNPEAWEYTTKILRQAMEDSKLPYVEGSGEGAFYGPKIDFQFRTVTGREETASTNQLDFAIPPRLDLKYVGSDGKEHHPYIIHRAPAGTHERFVAFLIEHFGGAFPPWLAPVQVAVVPVAEAFFEYTEKIVLNLRQHFIRAEGDLSSDSMGKKIRNYSTQKVPYVLVVGEQELQASSVTIRRLGSTQQVNMPLETFKQYILQKIHERSIDNS